MITFAVYTDIGNRDVNEDSIGYAEDNGNYYFIVADGLGGHGKGEVASRLVVEQSRKVFLDSSYQDFLKDAFQKSQDAILEEQRQRKSPQQMKTTAVMLLIKNSMAKWGFVGDSRLYCFSKNKIKARTLDHSVPQMLVLSHEIKEKEIRNHPDRNRLLRVIGDARDDVNYEESEEMNINEKTSFLLCTDGFWELIEEKQMSRLLKQSKTAEEWLRQMAAVVKENGRGKDMDNNSAIAVFCR